MLNDVFSYLEKIKTILHSTGSKQMYGFLLVCVCECVFFFFFLLGHAVQLVGSF